MKINKLFNKPKIIGKVYIIANKPNILGDTQ